MATVMTDVFAKRLRSLREARGFRSREALSQAIEEATGETIRPEVITNLELGRRDRVTVEEVFALAITLKTSPTNLLVPADDEEPVAVAPNVEAPAAIWVRGWLHDSSPMPPSEDLEEFLALAPPTIRRRERIFRHPAVGALTSLRTLLEEAVDRHHPEAEGTNVREHPREHAEALRREVERLDTYVKLLADELDGELGQDS